MCLYVLAFYDKSVSNPSLTKAAGSVSSLDFAVVGLSIFFSTGHRLREPHQYSIVARYSLAFAPDLSREVRYGPGRTLDKNQHVLMHPTDTLTKTFPKFTGYDPRV